MNWTPFWLILAQVVIAAVVLALPTYWIIALVSHAACAGPRSLLTRAAIDERARIAAAEPTSRIVWADSGK